jgi:hypothetical protein
LLAEELPRVTQNLGARSKQLVIRGADGAPGDQQPQHRGQDKGEVFEEGLAAEPPPVTARTMD